METVLNSKIEIDELICPITYELFQDPVTAKDGYVYERRAITKWILMNGASPFTRQPLQIQDLQPDNRLRFLAAQRRTLSVSYNVHLNTVTLPPLQPIITQKSEERLNQAMNSYRSNKYCCKPCLMVIISILAILIVTAFIISVSISNR